MKRSIFALLLLLSAGGASADCWLDGESYPTGEEVDGFVCLEDGTWG